MFTYISSLVKPFGGGVDTFSSHVGHALFVFPVVICICSVYTDLLTFIDDCDMRMIRKCRRKRALRSRAEIPEEIYRSDRRRKAELRINRRRFGVCFFFVSIFILPQFCVTHLNISSGVEQVKKILNFNDEWFNDK